MDACRAVGALAAGALTVRLTGLTIQPTEPASGTAFAPFGHMRWQPVVAALIIAAGCTVSERSQPPEVDTIAVGPGTEPTESTGFGGSTPSPPPGVGSDSAPGSGRSCGVDGTSLLTDRGIGALTPGMSVDEAKRLCDVTSDARVPGSEGMMERILVVDVAGETVRALVNENRIIRLDVRTPRYLTRDSLGVDTSLGRLAAMRGAQFHPGENGIYAFVAAHCALSFRFSLPMRPPAGGVWTARTISAAHGEAAVNRVLVTECRT